MTAIKVSKNVWVPIVGIEVHAKVNSLSKLFSSASTSTRSSLNSGFDIFDVSLPGSLPRVNEYCIRAAVKTASCLGLQINQTSVFDRKHYFYADLPAGYQITQQRIPLASGGVFHYPVYEVDPYSSSKLVNRRVRFDRIQLEHDSAKTITLKDNILVDMNRCGVPLMEIVTKPDFQFGYQVSAFVRELVSVLKCIDTCDCRFNDGSIRVDSTVSVHRIDSLPPVVDFDYLSNGYKNDTEGNVLEKRLVTFRGDFFRASQSNNAEQNMDSSQPRGGVIVEIKNINSTKFLQEAIDNEILRQIEIYEGLSDSTPLVENETRAYSADAPRKTIAMRDKTKLHDYRFLPETNLPPLVLKLNPDDHSVTSKFVISEIIKDVPKMPAQVRNELVEKYGLTSHSIGVLFNYSLLPLFNHIVASNEVFNANTLVGNILLNCMFRSRPPVKIESLLEISSHLAQLSNLKDKNFCDSLHVMKFIQFLVEQNDEYQTYAQNGIKDCMVERKIYVEIPDAETEVMFESFYKKNMRRFQSLADIFADNYITLDLMCLETSQHFLKLQKKFGRTTKNMHNSDFALKLFLDKINSLK